MARRVIASPWLRVLAVGLGTAVPWLIIASHLLTENLAFPLFAWASYAIVVTAERPTWRNEMAALVAIAALALCRLNLAAVFAVLVVAGLVDELYRYRARDGASRGTSCARPPAAARSSASPRSSRRSAPCGCSRAARSRSAPTAASPPRPSPTACSAPGARRRSGPCSPTRAGSSAGCSAAVRARPRGRPRRPLRAPRPRAGRAVRGRAQRAARRARRRLAVDEGAALEERYVFYSVGLIAILAVAGVERAGGCAPGSAPAPRSRSGPSSRASPGPPARRALLRRPRQGVLVARARRPPAPVGGSPARLDADPADRLAAARRRADRARAAGAPPGRRAPLVRAVLAAGLGLCLVAQALSLNYDFRQEPLRHQQQPGRHRRPARPRPSASDPRSWTARTGGKPAVVPPSTSSRMPSARGRRRGGHLLGTRRGRLDRRL